MSSRADRYAFQVIPERYAYRYLGIRPSNLSCSFFQVVIIFTFVSLFSTASLLIVLSYKAIKKYIGSQEQGYEPSTPRTLGYFWLVNLFVSGTIIKYFSEIRICAMSRILNHHKPFHTQLCPPRSTLHSPRNSCRVWRCRVLVLVIRYCRTHVYLTSWWTSNQSMGFRKGHFWQSTMDSMYWYMARHGVPFSHWAHLNQQTSS